ncbi:MAG: hypothetical protein GY810_14450 [Aureispira sp.]|nr:hypothetical protein [Aureispira sp.]
MPQNAKIESEEKFLEDDVHRLVYDTIKALPQSTGVSINQLVQTTGLPIFKVEMALKDFMEFYPTRLQVNEEGELIYFFKLLRKLPSQSFGKQLWSKIKLVFEFIFKLWITLMVYVMGIVYGGALTLLGMSSDPRIFLGAVVMLIVCIIVLITDIFKFLFGRKNKTVLQSIFRMVLGPKKQYEEQLKEEKNILKWIITNQYKITTVDLVILTGWSLEKSEEELTNLLINYQGEVYVTEEGVIVYHFPKLDSSSVESNEEEASEKIQFAWSYWKMAPKWHPSPDLYKTILAIIWINLLVAMGTTIFSDYRVHGFWGIQNLLDFNVHLSVWTTYFLLAFSIIFLLLNKLNRVPFLQKVKEFEAQKVQSKLLKYVFVYISSFRTKAIAGRDEEVFDQLRFDLDGTTDTNELGNIVVNFDRIRQELKVIQRERGELATNWPKTWRKEVMNKSVFPSIEEQIPKFRKYRYKDLDKAQKAKLKNILSIPFLFIFIIGGIFAGKEFIKTQKSKALLEYEEKLIHASSTKRLELNKDMNFKTIKYIEATIDQFKNLTYLSIQGNESLEIMKATKNQLQLLDTLIIEGFYSKDLDASILNLPNLHYLKMNSRYANKLPNNIVTLNQLKTLELENFDRLPNSFADFPNLEQLTLKNFRGEAIPIESLSSLKKLETLKVINSHPKDNTVPSTINQLQQLKYLDLNSSFIFELPIELGELQNLEVLDLSELELSAGQLAPIFKLINLKKLYLRDTKIAPENQSSSRILISKLDSLKEELQKALPGTEIRY